MDFCGSVIKKGDAVFDVALGPGFVEGMVDGFIVAKFNTRYVKYDQSGRTAIFNNRTLYWQNPFFGIEPTRDREVWQSFVNIANVVSNELKCLHRKISVL